MTPSRAPLPPGPRLLGVFAHPDDESWGLGGTLAKYAAQGAFTALLCATRGEVGEVADPSLASPDNLAQVRSLELRRACRILNVRRLRFLGVTDGQAHAWDQERVKRQIVRTIRELRPQVVVTFGPDGITRHPDHVTIGRLATEAFHLAGDESQYLRQLKHPGLKPHRPARLYYVSSLPRTLARKAMERLSRQGVDTQTLLKEFEGFVIEDRKVTTAIDTTGFFGKKLQALRSHQTQNPKDSLLNRYPEPVLRQLFAHECFTLAYPRARRTETWGQDLFWGLGEETEQ